MKREINMSYVSASTAPADGWPSLVRCRDICMQIDDQIWLPYKYEAGNQRENNIKLCLVESEVKVLRENRVNNNITYLES